MWTHSIARGRGDGGYMCVRESVVYVSVCVSVRCSPHTTQHNTYYNTRPLPFSPSRVSQPVACPAAESLGLTLKSFAKPQNPIHAKMYNTHSARVAVPAAYWGGGEKELGRGRRGGGEGMRRG